MLDRIKICKLRRKDIKAFIKLYELYNGELGVKIDPRHYLSGNYYIVGAFWKNTFIGYAIARYSIYPKGQRLERKLHVMDIAVHPEFRRQGFARRLLQNLISHAREKNLTEAYTEIAASNIAAIRLFESEGFENRGTFAVPSVSETVHKVYLKI